MTMPPVNSPEAIAQSIAAALARQNQARDLTTLLTQLGLMNRDALTNRLERQKMQADSYAPGTKYAAGWEPGGFWDSIGVGGGGAGTSRAQVAPDDPMRLLGGVEIDDSEAGPYDAMIQKLIGILMPQDAAPEADPTPDSRVNPTTGGAQSAGGYGPAYPEQSIKPPLGAAGEPKNMSSQSRSRGSTGIPSPYAPGERAGSSGLSTSAIKDTVGAGTENIVNSILGSLSSLRHVKAPKLGGYEDGGAVSAPVSGSLIRVGERSPKDKKYATEEVVLAAPGTVVAPVPKGMENPSHEDALGLIMAQLLKDPDRETAPEAQPGHSDGKLQRAGTGFVTSSASQGRSDLAKGKMWKDTFDLGKFQNQRDYNLNERKYYTSRDQGNRQLDLTGMKYNQDYDLGLRNVGLGSRRIDVDRELGLGNLDLGRQNLNMNFQRQQEEFRNWQAERDLKKELGMRGLDIDQQRANQDFQLSSAQQAFAQIMAGITGSALPGVRAGRTPMLGLLG